MDGGWRESQLAGNPLDDPFIDVGLVRRYASDFDRMLAKIMVLSSGAFMIVVIMSIFVD